MVPRVPESWSGAKSEAKLRKSTKYPGGRRVSSRYTRVLRKIPGILPIWPKIWLILGPNQPQTRLSAQSLTISTEFSRENREEKRGCCKKGKENRRGARGKPALAQPRASRARTSTSHRPAHSAIGGIFFSITRLVNPWVCLSHPHCRRVPTGPKKRKEKRNGPPPIAALRVGQSRN